MRVPRLFLFLPGLLFCGSAGAGLDQAIEETPEITRMYAGAGDPSAQYNLALRYAKGEGVKQDAVEALLWYRKAAEAGFPEAQYNLGVMLSQGEGVPKDEKEGVKWLAAAAAQGIFPAQKAMIRCYTHGLGVEASAEKALTWDFLARRSLELHFEQNAGTPPKPAKLRADDFAEYVTPAGVHEALGPDGSVEHQNADGTRTVEHPGGATTAIGVDGGKVTKNPDGSTITEFADGTRVTKDRNGTIETRLPDGTRTVEGDGRTSRGEPTHVLTKYDKDGKTLSQRFISQGRWIEVLPDGANLVEEAGEDEQGRKVRIIDRIDKNGTLSARQIVREDGVERTGEEQWVVTHWSRQPDGTDAQLRTKYGLGNSTYGEEVLGKRQPPPLPPMEVRAPAPNTVAVSMPAPAPLFYTPYIPGNEVLRQKTDIAPQLAELEKLARESRYYAGVTDAIYERARAGAEHFVFALPKTPQKPDTANHWLNQRLAEMDAPSPPPPLRELPTDRSEAYPLGFNGREAIHLHPWKHAETEHFVVHYTENSDAYAAMRYIECAFFVVAKTLQLDPALAQRKMHVFVFPDAKAWQAYLDSRGLPHEVAGFAYKDELLLGAHEEKDAYVKTLCHEATHAIVAHFYPGRKWPLWLNEGFAEYMAAKSLALRRSHQPARYLAKDVSTKIDIARIFNRIRYGAPAVSAGRGVIRSADDVGAFYAESEKCVRVLLEKLPGGAFAHFANLAFAGNAIPACLRESYGEACGDTAKFQALVNGTP